MRRRGGRPTGGYRPVLRAAILVMLAAMPARGEEGPDMERTFTLSRALAAGTIAFLEVEVGPLAAGRQVRVTTPSGMLIGTVAPFGPAARGGGVYSLPVPADAIRGRTLSVRVTIVEGSEPGRAPTATEVTGLKLLTPDPTR